MLHGVQLQSTLYKQDCLQFSSQQMQDQKASLLELIKGFQEMCIV